MGNYKFSDDALLDGSVPTITSGPTANVAGDNTTIYWNTDEPSTTVVHYGPPSVPVLIDPAPLPTGQNTVSFTLNWNSSTDPNNNLPITYTAQLSRLPDFSTIAQTVQNQAGTGWNLSITDDYGITPVTWYWRVRARNSEGADSAWASKNIKLVLNGWTELTNRAENAIVTLVNKQKLKKR